MDTVTPGVISVRTAEREWPTWPKEEKEKKARVRKVAKTGTQARARRAGDRIPARAIGKEVAGKSRAKARILASEERDSEEACTILMVRCGMDMGLSQTDSLAVCLRSLKMRALRMSWTRYRRSIPMAVI